MLLALPRSCQFCYFTWVVCVGFLESRARASVIGLCFTWRDSVNYRGVGHSWFVCFSYLIGELSSSTLPVLRLGQIFKSEIEIEGQICTWKEYSEVGPEGKKSGMEEELISQKRAEQNPGNVTSVQLQGALQMENHLLGIHRALGEEKARTRHLLCVWKVQTYLGEAALIFTEI